jgi:hypothetical protein
VWHNYIHAGVRVAVGKFKGGLGPRLPLVFDLEGLGLVETRVAAHSLILMVHLDVVDPFCCEPGTMVGFDLAGGQELVPPQMAASQLQAGTSSWLASAKVGPEAEGVVGQVLVGKVLSGTADLYVTYVPVVR